MYMYMYIYVYMYIHNVDIHTGYVLAKQTTVQVVVHGYVQSCTC